MSLADLPLNDQIVEFGFGWHGRHVVPITGVPYIELASGRRIMADGIGTSLSPSTYLVDNDMPEVTTVLDDPEAALWRVAIVNGGGTSGYFQHWATKGGGAVRRVRVGDDYLIVNPTITNFGPYVLIRAGLSTGIPDQQVSFAALGDVPSDFNTAQVVDIRPDGRGWIFALSKIMGGQTPYQIGISESSSRIPLSLIELEFDAALSAMSYRVLASYEQCRGERLVNQPGADFDQRIHFVRYDENGKTGESDYAYDPGTDYDEPQDCSTTEGWPCSDSFLYSTGTSVSKSLVQMVTGAWYDATGSAQLLTLRIDDETTFAKGAPAAGPGGRYYWDTFTRTHRLTATAAYGAGAFEEYFRMTLIHRQTPDATDYSLALGGGISPFTASSVHGIPTTHQTATQIREEVPPLRRVVSTGILGETPVNIIIDLAREYSNKVRGALVRAERDSYCEYFASACMTPGGLNAGYQSTGNVYPGDRDDRPNFDLSLWRHHTNFAAGSYNPVTGQVARNQVGGDRYTWV